MAWRVTRDEPRVTVGNYSADLHKGDVLTLRKKDSGNRGTIPKEVAEYLIAHDLLIECDDKAEANAWYDSEDETLSGVPNDQVHGPIGAKHNLGSTPEN